MTQGSVNALPLVIAVTGHRDLVAGELQGIRDRVRRLFVDLSERYPGRRLTVVSSLAEGADQLAAEAAVELGLDLIVPLPMPEDAYLEDFGSRSAVDGYRRLRDQANELILLERTHLDNAGDVSDAWSERDRRYAELGIFLAAHCHILLAIWDGKESERPGGTGHIVRFHHDDSLPGYYRKTVATQRMLVDDESDLIYHVVCSRDRTDGAPRPDLEPLDCWWFTKDEAMPRSAGMPAQHAAIFRRSGGFSEDTIRHAVEIESQAASLLDDDWNTRLPAGIEVIDRLYGAADWLAMRYQRMTLRTLQAIHLLAFVMGLMFILYSDFRTWQHFLVAFLVAFAAAAGLQLVARRRGWHRKYLDYRALAEGLRVQFYWAAAGVRNQTVSKFTHDSFLQAQDPEVGWIRNVMRVAGLRVNARPFSDSAALDAAIRLWVGAEGAGQLGYFRSNAQKRIARRWLTEWLGRASLLASAVVVFVFLLGGAAVPEPARDPLMVSMGVLLLVFAIRHSYGSAIAEKELVNQYEFMLRVFRNAHRRLAAAIDDDEKRQILLALGGAALDEQAEWLLRHRERSIDHAEIWRMGS